MFFKKSLSLLTLLLAWVTAFSQQTASRSFELQWNEESQFPIRGEKTLTLPMVDGQFFGPDGVPTFTTSFNVQNNTIVREFQIKNVKFSNLPNTALKDLPRNRLPKDLNAELKITKIREQQVAVLTLNPLLNENGQARKLLSFTLEYSLGSPQENATANRVQNLRFTNSSVLAQGTWYKFRVDTTGVFRIGREQLQEIGVSTSGLDPADIRIFGNGGRMLPQANSAERTDDLRENALFIYGGEDGSFDEGDYVLFYAIGPHGWDIDKESFRLSQHETNIYSDHAYYFLTVDNGKGQRIAVATPPDTPADASINTYQDFLVHESESINLFANGQQWMGEDFSFEDNQAFDFDISDLDNSQDITIRMRGAAVSFSDTRMRATINGQEALLLQFDALSNNSFALATTDVGSREVAVDRDQVRVEVSFENGGNPSSRGYLDYIELIATRKLIARGKQFSFRNVNSSNTALLYEYRIQNAADPDQVWDVSDPYQPRILPDADSGNDYVFKAFGGTDKEFVFVDPDDLYQVEAVNDNRLDNQNLHGLKDVDYLIISPAYLMTEAERLADHHRQRSGWNVQVVDLEAVYNEFASGSPDLTSIRDFVRFLYQTASSPAKRIRYLCLFGDSSFDFKDRITDNNNVVPAFQSYESFNLVTSFVTDDYFGMMDENEGELGSDDMQDVATGRFPVTSLSEAREAVDKTLQYYDSASLGDWRNTVTFVADDPDTPGEFVLQETVDQIARELEAKKPSFNLKKIYADAFQQESSAGGERYPSVNEAIDNAVETGSLVLDYFGHGGVNGWANERILEVPQIQKWNNFNTLPLFITVTCEFARFDNPIRPTAGEYTFLNSKGGAVNMIATSREIFIGVGQVFNSTLMQNLFGFEQISNTISEALMRTKNEFRSVQRLFVYNFGDPAMRLAQAGPDIRITKINEKDVQQSRDTLKALSRMRLEGVVTDGAGQIATDFNGTLTATIYDKPLDKTTLDNDNFGRTMPFTAIESKIFRGRASVNNGAFSVDFIVPKDIRIAYGKAKISLYAENQEVDRTGADLSVTIGGIDPNAPTDTEGPTIRLYMNDESFVDGGNTSESPLLYAVLEDPSGINTSITAVDHDIIAILDDDHANPYVLNDYYETELNDFRKGKVKFPLRDLEPGLHTIKFKCWDTYNNPSESALNFIVVNDNDLVLSNVLNYPNPFVNYTEFWFNHNKPNEMLEVQVQIFTVSGKLIRTLNRSIQSEGLLSREITWDGLDDFGNKIGKGVYVYKLRVRSPLSNAKAEKFEKLVILQ